MHFSKLKELVRKLGGVLVLDGDEPEFVILPYDKYENMEQGEEVPFSTARNGLAGSRQVGLTQSNDGRGINADPLVEEDQEAVERLNQEIIALKEEIRLKEEAELVADEQSTEPVAETIDLD